jgi:hypothetical protein
VSRAGEVSLDWGGQASRLFRLGVGQLRKLQENTGYGPFGLAAKLRMTGEALAVIKAQEFAGLAQLNLRELATFDDCRETILQGLLGADVPAPEALKLVRDWVEERPLAESVGPAYLIAIAAVVGVEDEPLGEGEGATPPRSPTASSVSP